MRQHAVLGRHLPGLDDVIGHLQQPCHRAVAVIHRVDPDDRIAAAKRQPFIDLCPDTFRRIGRVVGLQPAGERAGQANRVGAVARDTQLAGSVDQVQVRHQLGHRRHHLGGQAVGDAPDILTGGGITQQPFAQLAHRPVFDPGIDGLIDRILDHAGDFVFIIWHRRAGPQGPQRYRRQHQPGRGALGSRFGCQARQAVARFLLVSLAHQDAQVGEFIRFAKQHGS